ncbi:MAG: hypothetical protein ABW224_02245 [Kibdelosporangium sp.]
MAAPVRTKIDLSQLDARPVLRLVPPLPEIDESPAPRRAPRKSSRAKSHSKSRHRVQTRVAACTSVIRRRRRVAASILIALVVFLGVIGIGMLAGAMAEDTVPDRTAVVWVEPGETLWEVAERSAPGYDTGAVVHRIHELNEIPGNEVLAGQALQVPFAP